MNHFRPIPLVLVIAAAITSQCSSSATQAAENSKKTILAIFAHPDDESAVAPVLAKYASEGFTVYLAVATDGRLGVNEFAHIPGGDSLAAARKLEMACAAEKLGINPPIMFGLHDQFKMKEGMGSISDQLDSLRKGVRKLFNELNPDVVITWGASGWTGHLDHRLTGAVVTEVFESQKWVKPAQLYYPAIPTGKLPPGWNLATVDSAYLTVKVPVTDADYEKAKASWLCHASQYKPETVEQMFQLSKTALKGKVYFHPFRPVNSEQDDLFEATHIKWSALPADARR